MTDKKYEPLKKIEVENTGGPLINPEDIKAAILKPVSIETVFAEFSRTLEGGNAYDGMIISKLYEFFKERYRIFEKK